MDVLKLHHACSRIGCIDPGDAPWVLRRGEIALLVALLVLARTLVVTSVWAQTVDELRPDDDSEALSVPARVGGIGAKGGEGPGLDALLHLPRGYLQSGGRVVGGAGESEWRRRFERAVKALRRSMETAVTRGRALSEQDVRRTAPQ